MHTIRPDSAGPSPSRPYRVVVVGAGMAGLNAARLLSANGHPVTVVEKARGAGGRMGTRRQNDWQFDHGAQYFTVRSAEFQAQVDDWTQEGIVARWERPIAVIGEGRVKPAGRHVTRYVALPGMSSVCSAWASRLADVRFGWEVTTLSRKNGGWNLEAAHGERLRADVLVLTTPPEQALRLLHGDTTVTAAIGSVRMRPCWAVLAVLDRPLLDGWAAAFVNQGPLAWIASQDFHPGCRPGQAWVLHASADWSERHLEDHPDDVAASLLAAAQYLPAARPARARFLCSHRWRYALAEEPLRAGCLWFESRQLVMAGDWCHGSRVEGAYLSGAKAARCIDETALSDTGAAPALAQPLDNDAP